jgi:K+-sensing histidine kinase KdpD
VNPHPRRGRDDDTRLVGLALAVLGPILVAVALVPLRDEVAGTNLALLLVVVIVAAAIVGGRGAGAISAVVSTLAFDFFLVRPYLSMDIQSTDDVETVLIFLLVGLLVGEVAARGRQSRQARRRATDAIARVQRVGAAVAQGSDVRTIAASVTTELTQLLHLRDCMLELPPYWWPLPVLERSGAVATGEHDWRDGGFTLPEDGVQLPVIARGSEVARLVLLGDPDVPLSAEERAVAVTLADQLGTALVLASPEERADLAKPPA